MVQWQDERWAKVLAYLQYCKVKNIDFKATVTRHMKERYPNCSRSFGWKVIRKEFKSFKQLSNNIELETLLKSEIEIFRPFLSQIQLNMVNVALAGLALPTLAANAVYTSQNVGTASSATEYPLVQKIGERLHGSDLLHRSFNEPNNQLDRTNSHLDEPVSQPEKLESQIIEPNYPLGEPEAPLIEEESFQDIQNTGRGSRIDDENFPPSHETTQQQHRDDQERFKRKENPTNGSAPADSHNTAKRPRLGPHNGVEETFTHLQHEAEENETWAPESARWDEFIHSFPDLVDKARKFDEEYKRNAELEKRLIQREKRILEREHRSTEQEKIYFGLEKDKEQLEKRIEDLELKQRKQRGKKNTWKERALDAKRQLALKEDELIIAKDQLAYVQGKLEPNEHVREKYEALVRPICPLKSPHREESTFPSRIRTQSLSEDWKSLQMLLQFDNEEFHEPSIIDPAQIIPDIGLYLRDILNKTCELPVKDPGWFAQTVDSSIIRNVLEGYAVYRMFGWVFKPDFPKFDDGDGTKDKLIAMLPDGLSFVQKIDMQAYKSRVIKATKSGKLERKCQKFGERLHEELAPFFAETSELQSATRLKRLQKCADAALRLKIELLLSMQRYKIVSFLVGAKFDEKSMQPRGYISRNPLESSNDEMNVKIPIFPALYESDPEPLPWLSTSDDITAALVSSKTFISSPDTPMEGHVVAGMGVVVVK